MSCERYGVLNYGQLDCLFNSSTVQQANIKQNIKALPFVKNNRWFPSQRVGNTESISVPSVTDFEPRKYTRPTPEMLLLWFLLTWVLWILQSVCIDIILVLISNYCMGKFVNLGNATERLIAAVTGGVENVVWKMAAILSRGPLTWFNFNPSMDK